MNRIAAVEEWSPRQVNEARASRKIRLVDVRQSFEHWLDRIPGSELRPVGSFLESAPPDTGEEWILYCQSGGRSGAAAQHLASLWGRPIAHLSGGISAWKAAGLPTERWGRGGE